MMVSYCGFLVYEDLETKLQSTKRYAEQYIKVTAESFQRWPMKLDKKVRDRQSENHTVGAIPAPFCEMRYISDPRYLREDKGKLETCTVSLGSANVQFKPASLYSRSFFASTRYCRLLLLERLELGRSCL